MKFAAASRRRTYGASLRTFMPGQIWNPYPADCRPAFAFCSILYPLHRTVAFAKACRACRPWRCIGFTSFLKMPIRLAGRKMGLGTFYPPHAQRERTARHDPQSQACCRFGRSSPGDPGKQELAALWLRRFSRTFTCVSRTLYLGVPPPSCSADWHPLAWSAYALIAQGVSRWLRTAQLLRLLVRSRSLRSRSGSSEGNKAP